jgi:type IV secretion system protein VirB11
VVARARARARARAQAQARPLLNACLKCIPDNERLITVEDTREVVVKQPNAVHLLFNEEDQRISALNIFKVCLRLRPDRLFLSELRGAEVWPYLRAANSGHLAV